MKAEAAACGRGRPAKLSPDQVAEAARLRAAGWCWKRLQQRFDCSRPTLYRALRDAVCQLEAAE